MASPGKFREEFAARVKLARTRAGKTQEDMAIILDVRQDVYAKYEAGRGKSAPSLMPMHMLPKFCACTGASVDWLVRGDGEQLPPRTPRKRSPRSA